MPSCRNAQEPDVRGKNRYFFLPAEMLDEDGAVFTTIDHSDFGVPIKIEFPACDKNE